MEAGDAEVELKGNRRTATRRLRERWYLERLVRRYRTGWLVSVTLSFYFLQDLEKRVDDEWAGISSFDIEDPYSVLVFGGGGAVALWLLSAVVGAVDSIPVGVEGLNGRFMFLKNGLEEFVGKQVSSCSSVDSTWKNSQCMRMDDIGRRRGGGRWLTTRASKNIEADGVRREARQICGEVERLSRRCEWWIPTVEDGGLRLFNWPRVLQGRLASTVIGALRRARLGYGESLRTEPSSVNSRRWRFSEESTVIEGDAENSLRRRGLARKAIDSHIIAESCSSCFRGSCSIQVSRVHVMTVGDGGCWIRYGSAGCDWRRLGLSECWMASLFWVSAEGGLIVKNFVATLEPVTGDAEKEYWSLLRNNQGKHRDSFKSNRGRGGRHNNRGGRHFGGKHSRSRDNDSANRSNKDGLLLNSRCVLYKSMSEEVSIWGWPLQTSGLLTAEHSFDRSAFYLDECHSQRPQT
ncbi:hypothetical protein CASFOL_017777 [Castilleja foliolosa]|uniref:Uncharacterized protein n=1 Tax=Castilleja foliolosa TaxID=1961234 RepID=A0ABD3D7X4_9LAMI